MKLKHIILTAASIALLVLVAVRLKNNKNVAQNKVYNYDREKAIHVHADTVKPKNAGIEMQFTGNFEPDRETKISAENQGKIMTMWADVGSLVRKGQRLVQLDNSALRLQLEAVQVQIEGLEADIKRFTILSNADAVQGVQLEKAELGLKSAMVQKATLIDQINKTTITAPFDGIVTAKFTEIGAFAAPGVPLLQLTDISRLRFTVNVAENDLGKFRIGQDYGITADIYPDTYFQGRASMIGSKSNIANRYPIQFIVDNTDDLRIKSGMFGKLHYQSNEKQEAIVIPSSAIVGSMEEPQVYLVKDDRAVLHDISIGNRFQNRVIITNGLNEGDVIVTGGFITLFDNARVTIINPQP